MAGARGSRTHSPTRRRRGNGFEVAPSDTSNAQLVTRFLAERRSRSLSVHTIRFYSQYLLRFTAGTNWHLFDLNREHIGDFLDSLTCAPGGKHAYFRAIRAFYQWAVDNELIQRSPVERMKAPKVPKPIRYAVPLDALGTLLAACECDRDRLIVSLLADTGIRRSELASIRLTDVDVPSGTIRVWGKGAKERKVAFGNRTGAMLAKHLELWADARLLGMSAWGVGKVLERLSRATGIRCNAHSFRRTFATESIRNGMNVFHVQSLLGHSSLTMTRIYAEQVNSEDAVKAYRPILT